MKKIILATTVALGLATQAQAISISPLPRVDLKAGVATVRVDQDDSFWRADIYRVVMDENGEKLEPATDVVLSPRIFKAPRGLRIATKQAPTGQKELFYRLVLTQQVKAEEGSGIRPKFTISIPVVQAPARPAPGYVCDQTGRIRNTGNTHIKAVVENKQPLYILPGTSRSVAASAKNAEGGAILCPDPDKTGEKTDSKRAGNEV